MKKLKIKTLIVGIVLSTVLCNNIVSAESIASSENTTPTNEPTNNEIMPATYYYYANSIDIYRLTGKAKIYVTTQAVTYINHIYQDIRIYKNGVLYSSKRYDGWNCQRLATPIEVPAVSGDIIEVCADTYTEHNNCLESGYISKSMQF